MSRVGKASIVLPVGVNVDLDGLTVVVSGPKGKIEKTFFGDINIDKVDNMLSVTPITETKSARAMWGTARSIINNMVNGVVNGFTKEIELIGVGYRAALKGDCLTMLLGKSHSTKVMVPDVIKVDVLKQNFIVLFSVDKELLGSFVSLLMKQRPPEPYKGKGVRVKGQYVQKKEGKKN